MARLELTAQAADQPELGLKVDVVWQFQVFDEAGGLHVVGVGDHEFLVLRGRHDALAELLVAQCAVHERHRHGLALGSAENEAVTARELRCLIGAADELVDHLTLGEFDAADRHGVPDLRSVELHLDLADAHFARKGVVVAETALRRVAQRQQKALVAAAESLQALGPAHRKDGRLAGQVAGVRVGPALVGAIALDQRIGAEQIGHPGHRFVDRHIRGSDVGCLQVLGEQAVRVVERGPQLLTAGNVFEGRRHAALRGQADGVDRDGDAEPRQRGAVRAQQRDRFEHIALRLQQRFGGEFRVVQRALGHHARDEHAQLVANLRVVDARGIGAAPPALGEQRVRIGDRFLASLDGDVH